MCCWTSFETLKTIQMENNVTITSAYFMRLANNEGMYFRLLLSIVEKVITDKARLLFGAHDKKVAWQLLEKAANDELDALGFLNDRTKVWKNGDRLMMWTVNGDTQTTFDVQHYLSKFADGD